MPKCNEATVHARDTDPVLTSLPTETPAKSADPQPDLGAWRILEGGSRSLGNSGIVARRLGETSALAATAPSPGVTAISAREAEMAAVVAGRLNVAAAVWPK